MERLINFLESHMGTCYYKKFVGMDCPGCGFQRSLVHLLKGEITSSFQVYPALTTTIALIIFLLLHIIFKFKHGARILIYIFVINTILVLTNYVLKFI